jgi:hypothetical protein
MTCGGSAAVVRRRSAGGLVPHTPPNTTTAAPPHPSPQINTAVQRNCRQEEGGGKSAATAPWGYPAPHES